MMENEMKMLRKVENNYLSQFASIENFDKYSYISDLAIPDMYFHNFFFIEKGMKGMENFIKRRLRTAIEGGYGHILFILADRIVLEEELKDFLLERKCKIDGNLFMKARTEIFKKFRENRDCVVKRAVDSKTIEDSLEVEYLETRKWGEDFAKRKIERFGKVYSSDGVCPYVCYFDGKPVGVCEFFRDGSYVKFESLSILKEYRERGFATQMFRKMMEDAFDMGVENVYLIAEESDMPKEMYRKMGFEIVGTEKTVLWLKEDG